MKFKKSIITLISISSLSFSSFVLSNNYNNEYVNKVTKISVSKTNDNNNWTKDLDDYLKNGKFASAYRIVQQKPPAALIGRLQPWAEKNLTVAQWLYAEALYKEQRYEESAMWTYTAFFFTRYDASLCLNKEALNLEKVIVDSYSKVVNKSREDKEIINIAVGKTIDYLKNYDTSYLTTRDPDWICDMVDNQGKKRLTLPTDYWDKVYKERLNQFIKSSTGIENK